MLTPKTQLADILTEGSFSRNEWNHLLCLFNIMSFSMYSCGHFKSFVSEVRERIVIGAMSKRGQAHLERAQKQDLWIWWCAASTRGKLPHQVWDLESIRGMTMKEKESAKNQEIWKLGDSKSEVENSQVNRQEKVLQAARKLGQKDQTQIKSEENPPGTRKLAACSPEFRSMDCTNHRYMGKIFQNLEKKLGMSAINATFSMDAYKNQCIDMGIVFSFVDESRHPPWSGFLDEFGNLQEHKIREYLECIQHYSEVDKGTFWRNSECGMPGIFITIMDEINIGQWSSGQVGEGKSMCLRWVPFFVSDRWKIFQEQQKDGKAKLKISKSIRRTKTQ